MNPAIPDLISIQQISEELSRRYRSAREEPATPPAVASLEQSLLFAEEAVTEIEPIVIPDAHRGVQMGAAENVLQHCFQKRPS